MALMDSPNVVGLDLSLTSTGIACADGSLVTVGSKPTDYVIADRHRRLAGLRDAILSNVHADTDLVVIEGPSMASKISGSVVDRYGLWWLVVDALFAQDLRVLEVSPSTLKKYATGKGNATKPDMRMALFQRAQIDCRDDNQVDAAWLRHLGLDALGTPSLPLPATHRVALAKVVLP